jgi:hypothetical protein
LLYYRLSGSFFAEVQKYMVRITTNDVAATERFVTESLRNVVKDHRLMNISSPESGGDVELVYVVRLLKEATIGRLRDQLSSSATVRDVSTVALSDTVDY